VREEPQGSKASRLEGKGTVSAGEEGVKAKEKEKKKGNERGLLSEGETTKVDMMVRMIGYPREKWAAGCEEDSGGGLLGSRRQLW